MSSIKTHRVCCHCFEETKDTLNPTRSLERKTDKVCPTCKKAWNCISVAYSQQDKKWYQIRERTMKSKNNICSAIASKKNCQKGESCVHAHNHLEKEVWDLEKGKRVPNKSKFYCYVCKIAFQSGRELDNHMHSVEHSRTTDKMRLLPKVGSSAQIRERPDLSIHASEHQLCGEVAGGRRCVSQNACKLAHSEEERGAWNEALGAERLQGEAESPLEDKTWGEEGDMRRDGSFKIYKRPETSVPTTTTKKKNRSKNRRPQTPDLTSLSGNTAPSSRDRASPKYVPEFMNNLRRFIAKNGIHAILKQHPTHINLECNTPVDVAMDAKSPEEVRWLFRFTSCQDEQIHAIILYNHKQKFRIGQLTHGEPNGHRRQLQTKLYDGHTGCLLNHDIGRDMCLEVPVIFTPHDGEYKVYLVFQLMMSEVIAVRIHVKVRDASFNAPTKLFDDWIDKEVSEIPPPPKQHCVLWEQHHKIIPYPVESKLSSMKEHEVPAKIESMIASGVFDKIGQEILPDNYKKRFHDLLFLEEFDHKKRLVKYDLTDYPINSESAKKTLHYSDKEGGMVRKAPANFHYITFKLQYSLFEGYRSYKPPSQAYVIPSGSDSAFECGYVGRGEDEVHFMITDSMVEACENGGGVAQVRFAPDRNDYVRMHEAVRKMDLNVVFPKLKKAPIPWQWEEKSILDKAVGEKLSYYQMEGLMRIINTRFQTFPTLICGPFGCGKTHTLAVAAKLIALNFHGSTILIVAKNNSCANLYIEELSRSERFDSFASYKNKMLSRPEDIGPILFRHFTKTAKLSKYKNLPLLEYTKSSKITKKQDPELVYEPLTSEELLICGIIVTTTQGCFSLIELKDQLGKPDLFSHIFIDEAAQIIEPEACIPLHFAHANSKVVLAGDIHQTRPLVLSAVARSHGLDRTLLERFYDLREYETELLGGCRVELRENFRSQEPIVRFLSKLFYNDSLKANPPKLKGPGKFPCMSMVHVNGEEERRGVDGFFSFSNRTEGQQTIKALRRFVSAGVAPDSIMVLSTYRGHLKLVEAYLENERLENKRKHKCSHQRDDSGALCKQFHCVNDKTIKCDRLGKIQGLEYDVLIINTVRTMHDTPTDSTFESHLDLGLLDDPAQFNTILSRARGWVMVVGDTECLTSVGRCSEMWRQYREACREIGGFFPDGNITDSEHDGLFQGGGKQWAHIVSEQAKERSSGQTTETSQRTTNANENINKPKEWRGQLTETSQRTTNANENINKPKEWRGQLTDTSQRTTNANENINKPKEWRGQTTETSQRTTNANENKPKEWKEQKKSLLKSFISTCKEELQESNNTQHDISSIARQMYLAQSALTQIDNQYRETSTAPTPPPQSTLSRQEQNFPQERGAAHGAYAGVAKPKPPPPPSPQQRRHTPNFPQAPNDPDFAARLRFQSITNSVPFQPPNYTQRMRYPPNLTPQFQQYIPSSQARPYSQQMPAETGETWD